MHHDRVHGQRSLVLGTASCASLGEIVCVAHIDQTAELKGMQGWQDAGWTSAGRGTHHYSQVSGGALVALFFLPAGRISYKTDAGCSAAALCLKFIPFVYVRNEQR